MEELEDLILRLNNDKQQAVSVYDLKTRNYIFKNVTQAQIISEYGTAEDFFEKINADGYTRLLIYPRRKNGNAFKVDGNSFEINIEAGEKKQEKLHFTPMLKTKKKKKKKSASSGLFGLGAVEIMDLKIDAKDKVRFEVENTELRNRNKTLEDQIAELKEEKLKKQYTHDSNEGLFALAKETIKTLPMAIKSLTNSGVVDSVSGMTGLENDFSHLSEVKQNFIKSIENEDEEMVTLLEVIYKNIISSDTENHFASDLQKLLFTHEIIEQ